MKKVLRVKFHNGSLYQYHRVHPGEVLHLSEAESLGAYFNFHIRDHYPYEQVA